MKKSLEGKIKLPTRLEKQWEKILSICKRVAVKMRVFVCLFLVSVLGCSLAEGRVLIPSHLRRRRRNVDESEGLSGLAKMRGSFSSVDLHQRKKRSSEHDSSSEEEEEQWTLYGLFQLTLVDDDIEDDISCVFNIISKVMVRLLFQPDHLRRRRRNVDESEGLSGLAKMRGSFSSVDLHQRKNAVLSMTPAARKRRSSGPSTVSSSSVITWSAAMEPRPLVDDDIEDDISCVFNIISKVMVRLLFQPECDNETAEHYFAECKDQ
ncbi:hypothetical protein F7725_006238 [Dissostichus mawsoni]|uniref:Uncharacterized protein n=1 Tax=Dissostichus mawsoni TaxID=36200 RepID=A0A7J5YUK2_DISMA|nr:hypothetical protein F7725_006238 [Dissostichus mawsoni]